MKVAILGASPKKERYAHKAQLALVEAGHEVFPISRDGATILGVEGYAELSELPPSEAAIDTVTVYLRPELLVSLVDQLKQLSPRRIILNPGTESAEIHQALEGSQIEVVEACTLVLLQLGQF